MNIEIDRMSKLSLEANAILGTDEPSFFIMKDGRFQDDAKDDYDPGSQQAKDTKKILRTSSIGTGFGLMHRNFKLN